ncbi:MAG: hypothetical protein ABIH48_01075 [Candidatus Falkowbacteria bacterium]
MEQIEIKELLNEASQKNCTEKRRGEICQILKLAVQSKYDQGANTTFRILIDQFFNELNDLTNLLPLFAKMCGDYDKCTPRDVFPKIDLLY